MLADEDPDSFLCHGFSRGTIEEKSKLYMRTRKEIWRDRATSYLDAVLPETVPRKQNSVASAAVSLSCCRGGEKEMVLAS